MWAAKQVIRKSSQIISFDQNYVAIDYVTAKFNIKMLLVLATRHREVMIMMMTAAAVR